MVSRCCVCGEERRKNQTRTFHRLPKDLERRKKWVAILGPPSIYVNNSDVRVCSSHFLKDDFTIKPAGKRYLKISALPVLKDGQSLNNSPVKEEKPLGRCTEEFVDPLLINNFPVKEEKPLGRCTEEFMDPLLINNFPVKEEKPLGRCTEEFVDPLLINNFPVKEEKPLVRCTEEFMDPLLINNFPDMDEKPLERCTEEFREPLLKKHCMNLGESSLTASGTLISIQSETDEESKQPKTEEEYSQKTFTWNEWETLKTENKRLKEENSMLWKRIGELEKIKLEKT